MDFQISDQALKKIQLHPPNTCSVIVPHQTASQRRYRMGIITSGRLEVTNGIAKANAANQLGNWDRWCKFLTYSGITEKFLWGIPQEHKTIIVSSFAASVQINKFGTTKKKTLLHGTVKSAIPDVSASFRTQLLSDLTLESSGQTSLILKIKLRGYKSLDPTTKHQKSIPD